MRKGRLGEEGGRMEEWEEGRSAESASDGGRLQTEEDMRKREIGVGGCIGERVKASSGGCCATNGRVRAGLQARRAAQRGAWVARGRKKSLGSGREGIMGIVEAASGEE